MHRRLRQQADELFLGRVDVLVLVHDQAAQRPAGHPGLTGTLAALAGPRSAKGTPRPFDEITATCEA
jgi:hypothetical protein